nr:protein white-like [Cherax quadricarinatus]
MVGNRFEAVLRRSVLANAREPMVLRVKAFQTILIALLVGVIFLNQETNQDGITNLNGALFLLLTQMSFSNSMGVVNTFCSELPYSCENPFNGMYRTSVYFLCKNLAELPLALIQPPVFTAITYYMIGLSTDAKNFFVCMAILMLVANAAFPLFGTTWDWMSGPLFALIFGYRIIGYLLLLLKTTERPSSNMSDDRQRCRPIRHKAAKLGHQAWPSSRTTK